MGIGLITLSDQDQSELNDYRSQRFRVEEKPSFFTGALTAPFKGIEHGISTLADVALRVHESTVGTAAQTIEQVFANEALRKNEVFGYESIKKDRELYQKALTEARVETHSWMTETRADAKTMGIVAQIGHGLGTVLTAGAIGAPFGPIGAAATIGGVTGFDKYAELRKGNVDPTTAGLSAGVTGLTMAIGAGLPAYVGKTLAKQVASGVGVNVGLGAVERGATSQILKSNGYDQMAESYKVLDSSAVAIDAVLGAAFPLAGRLIRKGEAPKETVIPSEDTAVALLGSEGITQRTRDPVLQTSEEGIAARLAAEEEVTRQMVQEGRDLQDVEVPRGVMDNVVENPQFTALVQTTARVMDDMLKGEGISIAQMSKEFETASRVLNQEIENAIQIASPEKVDVREQAGNGKTMGEGNAQGQKAPGAREAQKEITAFDLTREAAQSIVQKYPGVKALNAEGREVDAKQMLDEANTRFEQEQRESNLYKVAVACAIGVGE